MFSISQQHCYTILVHICMYDTSVCTNFVKTPVQLILIYAPSSYFQKNNNLSFFSREILKNLRDKQRENKNMSVGMSKKV
jgi:hypothetical protein